MARLRLTPPDARVDAEIGAENIYRPAFLRGAFPTLRAAAASGNWATLTSLRGKFISLMTPHESWPESRAKVHDYVAARGSDALAFVCPRGHASEITGTIAGFTSATSNWVVCLNHKEDQIAGDGDYHDGQTLRRLGYVLRVWSVDSASKYQRAIDESLANFVAMDEPQQHADYYDGRPEGGYTEGLLPAVLAATLLPIL